ncbi:MAG: FtsX-like permease family protein [Candidatus Shapirobacteria bacterium]
MKNKQKINYFKKIKEGAIFLAVLVVYFIFQIIKFACPKKNVSGVISCHLKVNSFLNGKQDDTISRTDLIEISLRNLKSKKTRTMVTIGGMTIGIAAIVFLVSLGYGIQQLVITRVARLEEMRQTDVTPQTGGKLKINDKTLSDFKGISNVELSLPLISVVGRVNYKNSVSDMAVYGVTTDYLKQSAVKPIYGKIFESNQLAAQVSKGEVAGVSTENTATIGTEIGNLEFNIKPGDWVRVRESPDAKSKLLGYTQRSEGKNQGMEVWGASYVSDSKVGEAIQDQNGKNLGKWIKTPALIWQKKDNEYILDQDTDGKQVQKTGYLAESNVTVEAKIKESNVLGVSTDAKTSLATNSASASLSLVEIASESGVAVSENTKIVALGESAKKEAVINRAALSVLGIKENEAVGKKFTTSFVVVGDLLEDRTQKIESIPTEYTIIGVIPDDKTPVFYIPFVDLKTLGVSNYSQIKLVVNNQTNLDKTRRQIEAMGYVTRSVADTVAQINSLFATARTILALLGFLALTVAALGMFNTLTVSLLERTREVGLMKAMGMKSSEVQELFLTESMIIGLSGGVLGIVLGSLLGKLIGLILTAFALFKGVGPIDISYVPPFFILIIIGLSLIVGIVTGIYPARRATKISALNALRYE